MQKVNLWHQDRNETPALHICVSGPIYTPRATVGVRPIAPILWALLSGIAHPEE